MIYLNEQLPLPQGLRPLIRKHVAHIAQAYGLTKDVSITFCTRAFIQKLNWDYRNSNKATDVLSFEAKTAETIGDIIIATPIARENAERYGNTLLAEILYLIIHGLCHLHDHDHGTAAEIAAMRTQENTLLAVINKANIHVSGRI